MAGNSEAKSGTKEGEEGLAFYLTMQVLLTKNQVKILQKSEYFCFRILIFLHQYGIIIAVIVCKERRETKFGT